MNIEHPAISNMERTGYPDGLEPKLPVCPFCDKEADEFYKNVYGEIVGCGECIKVVSAFEAAVEL